METEEEGGQVPAGGGAAVGDNKSNVSSARNRRFSSKRMTPMVDGSGLNEKGNSKGDADESVTIGAGLNVNKSNTTRRANTKGMGNVSASR